MLVRAPRQSFSGSVASSSAIYAKRITRPEFEYVYSPDAALSMPLCVAYACRAVTCTSSTAVPTNKHHTIMQHWFDAATHRIRILS